MACARPAKGQDARIYAAKLRVCAEERGIALDTARINYERIRRAYAGE
ncbi:hypothetical protein [Methylobacterium oryzisoli]